MQEGFSIIGCGDGGEATKLHGSGGAHTESGAKAGGGTGKGVGNRDCGGSIDGMQADGGTQGRGDESDGDKKS